jgi:hypothetical protein
VGSACTSWAIHDVGKQLGVVLTQSEAGVDILEGIAAEIGCTHCREERSQVSRPALGYQIQEGSSPFRFLEVEINRQG